MKAVASFAVLLQLSHYVCCITSTKPHIVFIVADDLGWNDVGFRNPQMITPNLDRLAYSGVILNSSYVQPVCTPSRTSFMTGYFPYHAGQQDGVIRPSAPGHIPSNFTFLPQKLKEQGYRTHAIGKWHLGYCNWKYTPTFRGFDTYLGYYNGAEDYFQHTREYLSYEGYDLRLNTSVYKDVVGEYSANVFSKAAVDIINNHDPSIPMYLYLPFQSVHGPLQVPEKYKQMYKHIQNIPRRTYCGMVTAMDEAIGNITKALEETGLINNLFLVFTTDNGGPYYLGANNLPLRGAKTTLWEGGTKGTAFIYSKTLLKKTRYLNTGMMHAVDWFPTLLELAGGNNKDSNIDGTSQYDMLINGGPSKRYEFVYNIYNFTNSAAIRYKDYKLFRGTPGIFNDWHPLPKDPNEVERCSKDTFPPYMLYNISSDPTEHFDIAKKYPEIVEMMKARLEAWEKSAVPPINPPSDPAADPKNFGGNWSPGWC